VAQFTDSVGGTIPFSTTCLVFTGTGDWHSVSSGFSNGTFLTSGNTLFASALAPWSPVVYASLQGTFTANRGSGNYIITQPTGAIYSGGTFTLVRRAKKQCH
jgi:hypothetical protein